MEKIYLAVIAVLIVYIIILHLRLVKKNVFLETTVKNISGIEKKWKMDELIKFLDEIKKLSHFKSFFNEKLFEEEILNYIFETVNSSKIFIHYTKEESDARSIIMNGFRFVDTFYKTALPVSNDKLDLIIKHNSRKYFGDYLILICISNKIIDTYTTELDKAGIKNYFIENILVEQPPIRNENSDLVFILPKQFIKGYINHRTGEIINNPGFNPEFSSPGFIENIIRIKSDDNVSYSDKLTEIK